MSVFCVKKIHTAEHKLFDLTKIREDKNITLADLEKITYIPLKYLHAIEDFRLEDLPPAKAYRLAYLREYAKALDINYNCLVKNFPPMADQPRAENFSNGTTLKTTRFKLPNFSFYFIFRNLGFTFLILLFSGYFFWQVRGVVKPPTLNIYSPNEGFVAVQPNILIQGEATSESSLTINGQNIMINEQGHFASNIDLSKGVNTITISATKKHGKSTSLVRHVIYQEKIPQVSINK